MHSQKKLKTLLVEDHPLYREGILTILKENAQLEICSEASSGEEALALLHQGNFQFVISDLSLPGIQGVEFIAEMRRQNPEIKILILSMRNGKELIKNLLAYDIHGYIEKKSGKPELFRAIDQIVNGSTYYDATISSYLIEIFNLSKVKKESTLLTNREHDVLKLIGLQKSTKQIADQLCLSISTVESHRRNMFKKTDSKCVIGLIKYAVQNDLVYW